MSSIEVHQPRPHPLTEFFDGLRQTRCEMRAPPRSRRSAVLTIVRDEAVVFPIWLGYYARYFAPEDIYVLDHDSTDGSTDGGGFVRIPVEHDTVDITWMVSTMEEHQRRLLESYDVVVTVDSDEIVAPDPGWGTLDEYLSGFQEEWVNCLGYELIHLPESEPPLRTDRPVLEQRGHWFAAGGYDKPAVASAPTSWELGFHARTDGKLNVDPDLRLIHLHRMDYELCRERHRVWRDWAWAEKDLGEELGTHNRIVDDREFAEWFHTWTYLESGDPMFVECIPDRWRGLF